MGPYTRYGAPVECDPSARLGGAFAAGADTRALLRELGFRHDEIDTLRARGVIAEPESASVR